MPKLSRQEIELAKRQHDDETFHDDVLKPDSELSDMDFQAEDDKRRYERLKADGYSDDDILAHMFSDQNSAHKDCRICDEAMCTQEDLDQAVNEFFETAFEQSRTNPEALTMIGELTEKYASDEAKEVREISGGFLN